MKDSTVRGWRGAVLLALAICLTSAGFATAQEPLFEGVVVQDKVAVRAGAALAYYEVGELKKGATVEVEEVIYGWNRIRPPSGVYSYVSKAYVDAQGDGKVGRVNDNRVEVKAANIDGPGQSYRAQAVLNKGDRVRIVGEEGSFYKIEPPAHAYVFLPPGSVRRASTEEAQKARQSAQQEASQQQTGQQTGQAQAAQQTSQQQTTTEQTPKHQSESATNGGESTRSPGDENHQAVNEAGNTQSQSQVSSNQGTVASGASAGNQGATDQKVASATTDVTDTTGAPAGAQDLGSQETGGAKTAAPDHAGESQTPVQNTEETASAETETEGAQNGEAGGGDDVATLTLDEAGTQPGAGSAVMDQIDSGKGGGIETSAVSESLRQVEQKNIPLFMKPLEEQPFDEMIADYQQLQSQATDLPTTDRQIIRLRLAVLHRNQELARTLEKIKQARQAADNTKQQETGDPTQLDGQVDRDYDAVGKLLASGVYDGRHAAAHVPSGKSRIGTYHRVCQAGRPASAASYAGRDGRHRG